MVAAALGLDHLDGGGVPCRRGRSEATGLADFAALAEADDAIDRALDDRLTERVRAGDVLLESRLAGWLATRAELAALRIWIACDEDERARRVAGREGHDALVALEHNRDAALGAGGTSATTGSTSPTCRSTSCSTPPRPAPTSWWRPSPGTPRGPDRATVPQRVQRSTWSSGSGSSSLAEELGHGRLPHHLRREHLVHADLPLLSRSPSSVLR
ncbi:MAG: hypothetical protein R2746_11495 [Acidimicrobiales bacterium]